MPTAVQDLKHGSTLVTSSITVERLYRENRFRLLAIAKRNSACPEDAEEALQDAFVLFVNRFDSSSGAPPLAWITLTLKRRCWALYRNRRREWSGAGRGGEVSGTRLETPEGRRAEPHELAELHEQSAVRRCRLARLKPDERTALIYRGLGYSYREICSMTGWTYTKVNRCITEGRAALRSGA